MERRVCVFILAVFIMVSTGGSLLAQDQAARLTGGWRLAESYLAGAGTTRPGDDLWTNAYFIEFRGDGTFGELNFWNSRAVVFGTWAVSGSNLTLAQRSIVGALDWTFIGPRTFSLNAAGNVLTMRYSRTQAGNTWHYTHTFERL